MIFHLFCVPVASPEPPEGINKQYELFTFSKVYFWSVLNRTFLAHLISQGRSHDTSSILCVPVASPDPPEGINRQCELFTFSKVYFWSVPNRTFLAHQISQGRSHNFSSILCSSCPPRPPHPRGNKHTVRTMYFFKSLVLFSIQPNFLGTLDFIGTFS